MLRIMFDDRKPDLSILCIGAHSDDIEIGCGGTMLKLLAEHKHIAVTWLVVSAAGVRASEARESAQRFLYTAPSKNIIVEAFEDSYFPYIGSDIKRYFQNFRKKVLPDVIFTHNRHDLHQDHRLISELTWNAFRNHFILEYETIKYDGDIGQPNFYVPLTSAQARAKIETIMNSFGSQKGKDWFTEDTFQAVMRLRGVECRAPEKVAEAFYCRKATF
jgi:LmbE family N-acetylglucosaminyl deacetylase